MRGKSTLNRILLIAFLALNSAAYAQVTITENFDFVAPPPAPAVVWPNQDLPFGWSQYKVTVAPDPDNVWERINNTATNPTCTPFSGVGMMRYKSDVALAGSQAALVSKAYDFFSYPAAGATVQFRMYRDNLLAGVNDNIAVYINTAPNLTGAVGLAGSANPLNRPCGSNPAVACVASYNVANWYQYTYNIPYPAYSAQTTVYIILVGTSAVGQNMYIDNFEIITWPKAQTHTSSLLAFQNTADVGKNSTNNMVVGAKVTLNGAGLTTPLAVDSIIFNTNGTTLPVVATDFTNAKLFWTGANDVFSLSNAIQIASVPLPHFTNIVFRPYTAATTSTGAGMVAGNTTFTVASATNIIIGSTVSGPGIGPMTKVVGIAGLTLTISNPLTATVTAGSAVNANIYFDNQDNNLWVTYDVPLGATSGNYIDAEFVSIKLATTTFTPSTFTLPGARQIETTYCGGVTPVYSVGTSWLGGSYTNNDYISEVIMPGYAAVYPPGINNIYNSVSAGGSPPIPASSCTPPNCRFSVHPPDYEKFPPTPGKTATLMPDSSYTISLRVGTYGSGNYIAAWIDFNHDGVFTNTMWNVGGEKISQSGSLNNWGQYNANFTVPSAAFIGNTTMRVREVWIAPNIDPCASATYGEVEDFRVSIITPCAVAGWKVWLGFTDDWFTNTNWCGGVPTINDNALIPGGGQVGYKRPYIRGTTAAVCKKLRIEGTDTLYCDSYAGGSLTTADSLNIANATGRLQVNSAYDNTAVISTGNLYNALFTVLKQTVARQKVQLVYSRTELLAKGLVAGDLIDQVIFNIAQRGSYKTVNTTSPYTNFNINYYYTNASHCFSTTTYAPVVIPGGNVYSGTLNTGSIPYNTAGQVTIPITPFVWTGVPNSLVIEICYDLASTGTGVDRFEQTQTLGCNSALIALQPAVGVPAGCNLVIGSGGVLTYITSNRPNITYHFTRPYKKFNITVGNGGATGGDWINNGSFVPGISRVTFAGGTAAQSIRGTTPTTFYDLRINNGSVNGVTQGTAITVTDSLVLQQGRLRLNSLMLTVTNPLNSAITRPAPSGYLMSETGPPNYGRLKWDMGSNYATYVIPFINNIGAGTYIPFTYTPSAGTNDMTFATYWTLPNNQTPPTGVAHINGFYTGTDNSANMVDRFYQIDNAGTGGVADMVFSYASVENAANGNTNVRAQHWTNATSRWDDPNMFVGQSNPTTSSVLYPNSNRFGSYALVLEAQPLPIELLSFSAKAESDRVKLLWTTASELNNDFFTVERTINGSEYSFIDNVKSKGNSNSLTDYYTYDYKPLLGTQYYRLKQTDFDGKYSYSQLVPVTFGKGDVFEIVSVSHNSNGTNTVYFKYDSENPLSYKLVDIVGQLVFSKTNMAAVNGVNQIELINGIAPGVYTLVITDGDRVVSRKIFY